MFLFGNLGVHFFDHLGETVALVGSHQIVIHLVNRLISGHVGEQILSGLDDEFVLGGGGNVGVARLILRNRAGFVDQVPVVDIDLTVNVALRVAGQLEVVPVGVLYQTADVGDGIGVVDVGSQKCKYQCTFFLQRCF